MDQDGISGGEGCSAPLQPSPERRYKGVRLRKWGRWVSEIRMPNSRERIWLGSYESAEKAARAFDAAAVCLRGSRGAGSLNFPESPPDVRCFPGAVLTVEQIQAEAARHANCAYPAAVNTAGAGSSYSQQQEAAAPARSTSNDTAASVTSTDGGAAVYDGDDVIDWSFMDALPAMSASPVRTNAELVPAMDDFMFLHPMLPGEDAVVDVIDGNGDQTFF
ncbi:hypothetical protein E2562_024071 [Oryza meyeriana var. granulata]|uniref:AP2/ERF domain-containing protein n=1 Tax=Oryza meyeriana var. granulata TaxID=110450 RepID=A0A6G1CJ14_9ORYZ|nr:hypothetical protein E2562_024071 [Oryza meyeriana var. granulata]